MTYDFCGNTALVTGGSRGIGREVVKQLITCNTKVVVLGKHQENLDKLKREIPSVTTVCLDVSNWIETERVIRGIQSVNLLVNSAGITDWTSFGSITEDYFDKIYSINMKAIVNISQIIVEKLKNENKSGAIVNVSSMASMKHCGVPVYSTGKAALDRLTKNMAVDLAPFRIRVNSVNPTIVDTDMSRTHAKQSFEWFEKLIPLRRVCKAEDVANAILFLLSDKASMITGVNLPVDGGHCCT